MSWCVHSQKTQLCLSFPAHSWKGQHFTRALSWFILASTGNAERIFQGVRTPTLHSAVTHRHTPHSHHNTAPVVRT